MAAVGGGAVGLGAVVVLLISMFTGPTSPACSARVAARPRQRRRTGRELRDGSGCQQRRCLPLGRGIAGHRPVLGGAPRRLPQAPARHRRPADGELVRHGLERDRSVLLPARRDGVRRPDLLLDPSRAVRHHRRPPRPALRARARVRPPRPEPHRRDGAVPEQRTGANSNGVRTELQADCFAGAWVAAPPSRWTRTAPPTCSLRPSSRSSTPCRPRPPWATTTSRPRRVRSRTPTASRTDRARNAPVVRRGPPGRRQRLRHVLGARRQPLVFRRRPSRESNGVVPRLPGLPVRLGMPKPAHPPRPRGTGLGVDAPGHGIRNHSVSDDSCSSRGRRLRMTTTITPTSTTAPPPTSRPTVRPDIPPEVEGAATGVSAGAAP